MIFSAIEAVADAVLFEGYILYPYRPSAIKNRQRWNFGTLYPRAFAETQNPPERWRFQSEILLEASSGSRLTARVRFLQLTAPAESSQQDPTGSWEEGFARSRTLGPLTLQQLLAGVEHDFDLTTLAPEEVTAAPTTFHEKPRRASLTLRAEPLEDHSAQASAPLYRLHAEFANLSPASPLESFARNPTEKPVQNQVQDIAFTSAHLLLALEAGSFVSLLDPPPQLAAAANTCSQHGVFPVLVGPPGDLTRVLCSPIILYDHPEIAPESRGDFFDGTEMDEMLALRVLTLTDDEKAAMRHGDPHARAILERTETLPGEQLARVHGAIRGLRHTTQPFDTLHLDPFAEHVPLNSVHVFGVNLHAGDRVRLWPRKKADILDIAMQGKVAIIEAIEQDFEDNIQFAVVLEDDPGRDLGMLRQPGHRFFFSPSEVEPLALEIS